MKKQIGASLDGLIYDEQTAAEATLKLAPKTSPITRESALKIGGEFACLVRERIDPDALVFVFGSTVKGEAKLNSDIDIAVVTEAYGNDVTLMYVALSKIADEVSWDIEVHAVAPIN